MAERSDSRSGMDTSYEGLDLSLSYDGAVALWQEDHPGQSIEEAAAAAGVSPEQHLVNQYYLSPDFQGAGSQQATVGPGGNPDPNANIVEVQPTNLHIKKSDAPVDDNGDYIPGGSSDAKYDKEKASDPNFYKSVENNRNPQLGGGPPPPAEAPSPDPAPAPAGATPTYDDDGMAADTGGGGGGYTSGGGGESSRRSSGGGSSGGGGGGTSTGTAAPAAPSFGSSPNSYPVLPMTPIRQQIVNNLSGTFPNAGRFRTPPGGWREDMAPMFTTGAFGGANAAPAPAPASGGGGGGNMFMGGGSLPGGPAPSMPQMPQMPAGGDPTLPMLPDPNAIPPELAMGLAPQQAPQGGMGMGMGMPSFSQPGFVAPGSPYDMQMQRIQQQQGGGNAAPLPPSLRQRFGL